MSNPENNKIIEYMNRLASGPGIVHPDIEDRMKELSLKIGGTVLCKYKNSMIIKCYQTSSIIAVAFGTAYFIKTGEMFRKAIAAGAKTIHQWSDGNSLNLIESFGPDWIVGMWHKDEESWIDSLNT